MSKTNFLVSVLDIPKFTLMLVHLFTNAIALDWEIDFITNQTYYHEDYYGEGRAQRNLNVVG